MLPLLLPPLLSHFLSNTYICPWNPGDHYSAAAGEGIGWHVGLITQLSPVPGTNSELFFMALTLVYDNVPDVSTAVRLEQRLILKCKEQTQLALDCSAMGHRSGRTTSTVLLQNTLRAELDVEQQ
jgi:hypothetical protein